MLPIWHNGGPSWHLGSTLGHHGSSRMDSEGSDIRVLVIWKRFRDPILRAFWGTDGFNSVCLFELVSRTLFVSIVETTSKRLGVLKSRLSRRNIAKTNFHINIV